MIDVIVPTYNRTASLRKVIDSYMSQEELGLFIIVDDHSTDDTALFAKELSLKYPGKIVYHRPVEKTAMPELRNIGISLSKSEYIFMGEDDVLLTKDHFKILLSQMHAYNADVIGGRRIDLREGQTLSEALEFANRDTGPMFTIIPFEAYYDRFISKAQIVPQIHSNVLMKSEIFKKVLYDPAFGGNGAFREETDFFLRAADCGYAIWMTPETLLYHMRGMKVNSTGGCRKNLFMKEYLVWKYTIRLFLRNKKIFRKKFNVKNIYIYTFVCLLARYVYGAKRRLAHKRLIYAKT